MHAIRNAWYPLAWNRDLGETPARHRILGQDVVLFRRQNGSVAALDDACPHKLTPLSLGRVQGDTLECGYHGMTFDGAGRCVHIPGQPRIPAGAAVRSYPVQMGFGLVWIWMGEAAAATPGLPVSVPQFAAPGWRSVEGDALPFAANYLSLCENLLDPAHVNFVHRTTLGGSAGNDVPMQTEESGGGVLVWRWIRNAPPIPVFARLGLPALVDRWHYYQYLLPSTCIIDFGSAAAGTVTEAGRSAGTQIFTLHFITPVDDRNCIDHWLQLRNFALDDAQADTRINADLRLAYAEDQVLLAAIQVAEDRLPDAARVRLAIDAGPVRMQRLVAARIAAEGAPVLARAG